MQWLKRFTRKLRLMAAQALLLGSGYQLAKSESTQRAIVIVSSLNDYSLHSGHLRRGFKAGKRVQRNTEAAHILLTDSLEVH